MVDSLVLAHKGKQKVIWNKESDQAWDALKYLVQRAPIIYTANNHGKFCLKPDTCIYATAGVLYQLIKGHELWRIIDMHSQVLPKHMRDVHCRLYEMYGVVTMTQHWTIYLLKSHFIIATDHKPLIALFRDTYNLSTTLERQIV